LLERFVVAAILQPEEISQTSTGLGGGIFELIARSSLISQGVLALLLFFSIASWAIIILKLREFKRVETDTKKFIEIFRKSSKFSEVQSVCKSLSASPLAGVFQAGYIELNAQLRQNETQSASTDEPSSPRPALRSFEALDRSLIRASNIEVNRLEHYIQLLATTASVSPFIGLFGTVVGIIISFQSIGETGSTNLAVVAPGIAEALIATAAGLFAAIPAAYFYNHLTHKVKLTASSIDDFSLEFLNIAERNFSD
jgi:biopolymer transport protein TolQ